MDGTTRDTKRADASDPNGDLNARLFDAYFGPRSGEPVPDFSGDLEMSWILLQRLLEKHRWVEVVGTDEGTWICRVHDPRYSDLKWLGTVASEARTAPLAISRAAMRVAEAAGAGERATA